MVRFFGEKETEGNPENRRKKNLKDIVFMGDMFS